MIFTVDNTSIHINGKGIFKGLIGAYLFIEACRFFYRAEKKYADKLKAELKQIKKEQKLSKKKQKVESK